MKTYPALVLIFLFSLAFISCTDDTITDPPPTAVTSVSGKIENWTFAAGKTIRMGNYNGPTSFEEIGSGDIQTDGSFTLNLNTPMEFLLDSLTSSCEECTGAFTSTTPGVMVYGTAGGFIYQGTQIFGISQYINRDISGDELYIPALNDVYLEMVYFSKATTISGGQTYNFSFDGMHTTRVTRTADNVAVSAGWNKLYTSVTARTDSTATLTMKSAHSQTLKWHMIRF